MARLRSLERFYSKYPPDQYRCAACKTAVDPMSEWWRMGFNGWEHHCPDSIPQAGHYEAENVTAGTVSHLATGVML